MLDNFVDHPFKSHRLPYFQPLSRPFKTKIFILYFSVIVLNFRTEIFVLIIEQCFSDSLRCADYKYSLQVPLDAKLIFFEVCLLSASFPFKFAFILLARDITLV